MRAWYSGSLASWARSSSALIGPLRGGVMGSPVGSCERNPLQVHLSGADGLL
ncbi:hypothetical protein BJ968_004540 [Kineococcus aurantiacus]|uniref:Uncharacterized protein n=1 Tax=Kineococcus aurantiacus TaxID=37633 RepID=A0A7Y9DQL6_9ACTN|nr:hypothetical protein [Kineococcus aurantiacus]